jgi:hypothetical protein
MEMGVDGVITDDPEVAISCIAANRKTSAPIPSRE